MRLKPIPVQGLPGVRPRDPRPHRTERTFGRNQPAERGRRPRRFHRGHRILGSTMHNVAIPAHAVRDHVSNTRLDLAVGTDKRSECGAVARLWVVGMKFARYQSPTLCQLCPHSEHLEPDCHMVPYMVPYMVTLYRVSHRQPSKS